MQMTEDQFCTLLENLVIQYDIDGNDGVEYSEFDNFLQPFSQLLGMNSVRDVKNFFYYVDAEEEGVVDYEEILAYGL